MTTSGVAEVTPLTQPTAQTIKKVSSDSRLASLADPLNIAVVGATGGIGSAFVRKIRAESPDATVHAFSRSSAACDEQGAYVSAIELENESSIDASAAHVKSDSGQLSAVFVTTGLLHDGPFVQPEKSWRTLNAYSMEQLYRVNAIGPALVAKYFLPLLKRDSKSVFACLTARVGSIDDNRLGG